MHYMIEKTRNAGTQTEAAYWGGIRSALRRHFRYWKPALNAKYAARRTYVGPNKRQKWEYQCAHCKQWFMEKEVQTDHIIPAGSLKSGKDIEAFVERLTPEAGFQELCKPCHQIKTNNEREVNTK